MALIPDRFIESGVGKWIGGRISLLAWVLGGVLILLSVAACAEAFRRGSAGDRAVACLGALLTFWLMGQYFELFLLPVRRPPNEPVQATAATPLGFEGLGDSLLLGSVLAQPPVAVPDFLRSATRGHLWPIQ